MTLLRSSAFVCPTGPARADLPPARGRGLMRDPWRLRAWAEHQLRVGDACRSARAGDVGTSATREARPRQRRARPRRSASRGSGRGGSTMPVRPTRGEGSSQCAGSLRSAPIDSARPALSDRCRPTIAAIDAASQCPQLTTPRTMSTPRATVSSGSGAFWCGVFITVPAARGSRSPPSWHGCGRAIARGARGGSAGLRSPGS